MTPANGEAVPHELELGTFDPSAGRPSGVRELEWGAPVSENPAPGTAEVWAFYNFTGDAHPMHVHDVMFELVDRQKLDPDSGRATGAKRLPEPEEQGPKDTIIAYPGEVTRVRMTFGSSGQFVWHCHIAEHEDNEMMRPYRIGPAQPNQPEEHLPRQRHRP
jgi:FtsP/CotA-like multicopper oxidase with cupredoxin domain